MLALVKSGRKVAVRDLPRVGVDAPDDVVVDVAMAGVCRTDLWAADGRVQTSDPVVLGHELAGTVTAVGANVTRLRVGDRVTVEPFITCGACRACALGEACTKRAMLGVDRDGAFAEELRVPERAVHRLPAELPLRVGAFVEPVAACLAAAHAELPRYGLGVVIGAGRIARLTARVLAAGGFSNLEVCSPRELERFEPSSLAFAVATSLSSDGLRAAVRAVRRRGVIVLKSRDRTPIGLSVGDVVAKELTLRGVEYAPFPEAVALLASRKVEIDDLVGDAFQLVDHEAAFAMARDSEARKVMFVLDAGRR